MAMMVIGAALGDSDELEGSEPRPFGCTKARLEAVQLAPEGVGKKGGRGWHRQLDRISSGIYENAVKLQQRERQQLVRLAAKIQYRAHLADLRDEIKAHIQSM